MNDYRKPHQSHDIARFIAGSCVVAVLFVISVLAVKSAYGMYQTFSLAAAEAEGAAAELATLTTQHEQVKATLAALGTERGVEEAVRERFGVAKPGEGEIRIVREEDVSGGEEGDGGGNVFTRFFQALFVW
jgi:cell division protein FtsB